MTLRFRFLRIPACIRALSQSLPRAQMLSLLACCVAVSLPVSVSAPAHAKAAQAQSETVTISSAKELTAFRDAWNSGKYSSAAKAPVLKFKRDISLGSIDGWIPLGTMQIPFDGTVEGGGHHVSGTLSCAVPDNVMAAACGLFGYVAATPRSLEGAAIRGLDLDLSVAFQPTSTPQAPSPRARAGGFGAPEWSLSIGALAGRATRAAIENVRLTDKGAVNFSEASACRKMFSMTMMASSTTMPMARFSPRSVKVLRVKPRK